jgi:hypothetical protein
MIEAALPPAAQRVQALLREAGSDCTVVMMAASARSAAEAAAAICCTVAQIAKSLVFRSASGRAVLVIASGTNRVDERKVAAALGEMIGKASPISCATARATRSAASPRSAIRRASASSSMPISRIAIRFGRRPVIRMPCSV